MKTQILRGALIAIGVLIAAAMSAQFVSLSRCQAAYPCAFPFGLQYRPDPLIAGQYGRMPDTAISVRLPLRTPLFPQLDKRPQPDLGAVDAAVRKSLEMHPPPSARNTKLPARESLNAEPAAGGNR
jgi:hypothetical protein